MKQTEISINDLGISIMNSHEQFKCSFVHQFITIQVDIFKINKCAQCKSLTIQRID